MARVKVERNGRILFSTKMQVRVTDLNYGNHLGNQALLGMMHEVRVQFYAHLGFPDERNVFGTGLIMADAAMEYKAESFLHDELCFELAIVDISRSSYDITYKITNQNQVLVGYGKTGMVCFDYSTRKVVEIPAAFLAAI